LFADEIQLSSDQKQWSITIRFERPLPRREGWYSTEPERFYKTVTIAADNGTLLAIKNKYDSKQG
jgi:hypothetical protein